MTYYALNPISKPHTSYFEAATAAEVKADADAYYADKVNGAGYSDDESGVHEFEFYLVCYNDDGDEVSREEWTCEAERDDYNERAEHAYPAAYQGRA